MPRSAHLRSAASALRGLRRFTLKSHRSCSLSDSAARSSAPRGLPFSQEVVFPIIPKPHTCPSSPCSVEPFMCTSLCPPLFEGHYLLVTHIHTHTHTHTHTQVGTYGSFCLCTPGVSTLRMFLKGHIWGVTMSQQHRHSLKTCSI